MRSANVISPKRSYDEQTLVGLLKAKDHKAFTYLYDNYCGALFFTIAKIVGDKDLAADVLQETFVHIWRKIDSYDMSKGRIFTWMYQISKNAAIDLLRSKGYRNLQVVDLLSLPVDMNENKLFAAAQQEHMGLQKILSGATEMHRRLIDLSFIKGYTHKEIAMIEKIPVGTVKTRIRAGLHQLKHLYQLDVARLNRVFSIS